MRAALFAFLRVIGSPVLRRSAGFAALAGRADFAGCAGIAVRGGLAVRAVRGTVLPYATMATGLLCCDLLWIALCTGPAGRQNTCCAPSSCLCAGYTLSSQTSATPVAVVLFLKGLKPNLSYNRKLPSLFVLVKSTQRAGPVMH